MAVIQDLPQELLDRIIELTAQDIATPSANEFRRLHRSLPSVATKWNDAGQRAMWRKLEFKYNADFKPFVDCMVIRAQRTDKPLDIGQLVLRGGAVQMRRLLEVISVRIDELVIYDDYGLVPWEVLPQANIRRLGFWTNVSESDIHLVPSLSLNSLSVRDEWIHDWEDTSPSSLAALRRLLASSTTTLTELDIHATDDEFMYCDGLAQVLVPMAPNIRTFILRGPTHTRIPPESLETILCPYTNLRTLQLELCFAPMYEEILRNASPTLLLLDFVDLSSADLSTDYHIRESELVKWVDLPSLANLRRWRVSRALKVDTTKGDGALWLAKCKERGIEVRDERRYFTD